MIRVIYKKPNEKPYELEIENTLEKFQELVGGYIEVISVNQDKTVLMVMNEEGRLKELEPNVYISDTCIVGNVVFVANGNDGEFHSLTDDMIKAIINSLK